METLESRALQVHRHFTESFLLLLTTRPKTSMAAQFRRRVTLLLAVIAAVVLTACGAEVNSKLELESDYSGTRTFIVTMTAEDAHQLEGGVEAAEAVLAQHAPDILSFDGIATEDAGYSARFVMPFSDIADYEQKIHALLELSEVPAADRDMTVSAQAHDLQSSIIIEEAFFNDDLMGWIADALTSEGIVAPHHTVFTSGGTAQVTLDGQDITSATTLPRVFFQFHDDRRFDDVTLDLEFLDSGELEVDVSYLISTDHAAAQNAALDAFVAAVDELDTSAQLTDSGTVTPAEASGSEYRVLHAVFPTPESVAPVMQVLLGNDELSWEMTEQDRGSEPNIAVEYTGTNWTCDTICDPSNLQQLDGELTYPEHWELATHERDTGDLLVEFSRGIPLASMHATTTLGFTGEVTQSFVFVVEHDQQQGREESLAELFAPPADSGAFDITQQGSTTHYTATFTGQDAADLSAQLTAYFEAKGISAEGSVTHGSLSGLWASYDLKVDVSPIWQLTAGSAEAATFAVQLPGLHSPSSANTAQHDQGVIVVDDTSGQFTVSATGPTVTTVWLGLLALLVVVVLVVLLLRTRRASTRAWSVATSRHTTAESRAFQVQRPGDSLTATEIYASPLATHPAPSDTVRLPDGAPAQQAAQSTAPFPDVPQARELLTPDTPQDPESDQPAPPTDRSRHDED